MSETLQIAARRNGKNTEAVEQFNRHVPESTPVLYWPGERLGEGVLSRTRSAAWLLGGHTPVVMVEGYAGGIALTHVSPAPLSPHGATSETRGGDDRG